MDKKPVRQPSVESDEGAHTTFALKNRQAKHVVAAQEPEDAANDDETPKATMKRRATTYPSAGGAQAIDDDEDDVPEQGGSGTNRERATSSSSTDKDGEKKEEAPPDDTESTKATTFTLKSRAATSSDQADTKDDDNDADEEGVKTSLKRRATRYPGADKADETDDDDNDAAEDEEKTKSANTIKRRATMYPTATPTDENDEEEEEFTPKPAAAMKRRATIHHIVDEKTISDDEDEENYKPNAIALKRRNTIHPTGDLTQAEGSEETKAPPPSALKNRPITAKIDDNEVEAPVEKSGVVEAADATTPSALKSRPLTDTSELRIPSFIAKSSDSFAYYQYNLKATGEEADNYDFAAARPAMRKSNVSESILHLMKACFGSGVVTIPEAYKNCGLWTAFGLNIVIGIAVAYGMYMLTRSAQRLYGRAQVPMMLYPDVAEACMEVGPWKRLRKYGLWFRYTVDVTIGLGLFSACCIYQVTIAKSLKQMVERSNMVLDDGNPPLTTYIILLMLPCLLICMITTLKYMAPFTVVADVYILTITVTTISYGLTVPTTSALDLPAFKTVPGLFEFFGVCIFSMNGIGTTMSIENYMGEPKKFPIVVVIGMVIVICETTLMGFFGYWAFGEKVQTPVTLDFPYRPFPIVLKILLALMAYVSYALNFWVAFELVWYYVKMRHAPAQYWFWERIYRAMFVIIITIVAYLLPNVYYFTAVIGVFCFSNLTFIYPAFIELVVDWKEPGLGFLRWRLFKFIFFFLVGLAVFGGGSFLNTEGLITHVFL